MFKDRFRKLERAPLILEPLGQQDTLIKCFSHFFPSFLLFLILKMPKWEENIVNYVSQTVNIFISFAKPEIYFICLVKNTKY